MTETNVKYKDRGKGQMSIFVGGVIVILEDAVETTGNQL